MLEERSLIDKVDRLMRAEDITGELEGFVQTITFHMSELQVCCYAVSKMKVS